ncbi:hypothetical protein BD324DRAFT_621954 [Kockovaella imperatae]|uniref:Amidohydrolase-related domain-containing protein n=1 Tax=Kockovaella imperatae TaxID=4999 RepID=A0A1Y1UL29_9TREE|nr:hypothetical protein BD324DRAFT_621954 [Kockovaella imperatae]ORX38692.1 hypothetical protein BD324DRAFT_621954 [Kockovaella imperatae]
MDSSLTRRPGVPLLGSERSKTTDPEKDALLPTSSGDTIVAASSNSDEDDKYTKSRSLKSRPAFKLVVESTPALFLLIGLFYLLTRKDVAAGFPWPSKPAPTTLPAFIEEGIEQCKIVQRSVEQPKWDKKRTKNDRFVPGTRPTWLKNGTVWTGDQDGEEILKGHDILLDGGVIRKIGSSDDIQAFIASDPRLTSKSVASSDSTRELVVVHEVELDGAWVTPGIVDLHSHIGVGAAPGLFGNSDTNSIKAPILPWLRSLDAFNTHDDSFNLSISGGITTMLVLPGSAGNIGGTAYTFKPRWTAENTPASMQVEPPYLMKNGSWERTNAWRHIKHACGENPHRVYKNSRLDSAYDFRRAYTEGQNLKDKQDRWCASPKTQTEPFPTSLEWEPLADVLRGNVKVNIHCYETVDLNDMVRISNEFKFNIAAFHHAHETYLVPDLLKETYGGTPSVAIFATNARYKREAYRGSEFAPKILADAGINVVMKSDHSVLDSRYLVYEAAQAHIYGLNMSQALGTVTTHSARAMGLDHRIGYVRQGYDADVVVWDSFPLVLGATPKQTYIDGIAQIVTPHTVNKPAVAQEIYKEGKWDEEIAETLAMRGDPDLRPKKTSNTVIFQDVAGFYLPQSPHYQSLNLQSTSGNMPQNGTVVVTDGKIQCVGECVVEEGLGFTVINLKGGSIAPGATSVGSYMGLMEIRQEPTTQDGVVYDPLQQNSELLRGLVVHAADGIRFGSKDQLLAYRSGVTNAVAYPISDALFNGLSVQYSTSAEHPLSHGAILNPSGALHISLASKVDSEDQGDESIVSISTKLAVLRRMLGPAPTDKDGNELRPETELEKELHAVKRGYRRLVVECNRADIMASVIRLKRDWAPGMQLTFLGGAEAWMIVDELVQYSVGVVVAPSRSFPATWDQRRIMPGLPITNHSLASYLASKGVVVGLGSREEWETRNIRFEAGWQYANYHHVFSRQDAIDLVSANLEELLGLNDRQDVHKADEDIGSESWVAYEGDMLSFEGRVRAVKGHAREVVDLF